MSELASAAAELRLIADGFKQLRLAHAKVELTVHRKPLAPKTLMVPRSLRPPEEVREKFISGPALQIAPTQWRPGLPAPVGMRIDANGQALVGPDGRGLFIDGGLSSRVQGYCSGPNVAAIEDELSRANQWAKRYAGIWLGLFPCSGQVTIDRFAWPEVVIRVAEGAGLSVLKKPEWWFVLPSSRVHCAADLWRARKEFDFQYTPEDEAAVGDDPEFVWCEFPSIVRDSELAAGWLADRLEGMAKPESIAPVTVPSGERLPPRVRALLELLEAAYPGWIDPKTITPELRDAIVAVPSDEKRYGDSWVRRDTYGWMLNPGGLERLKLERAFDPVESPQEFVFEPVSYLSEDGRTLTWGGRDFTLTETTARVVKILVESYPKPRHETYLQEHGEFNSPMRTLVRDSGLSELIVRDDRKGMWKLADPKGFSKK